jgi:type II secretory pathway pseudopilin PulG
MVPPTVAGNMRPYFQKGFTYLAVMLLVLILMLGLGAASEQIATINKRDREAELIFVGEQYRNAIASYYQNSPGGIKQFPSKLESLVLDKRSINPLRHLRKLYRDPVTDSNEWGLVKTPQDEIVGIYSLSSEEVLTTTNNSDLVQKINQYEIPSKNNIAVYSDWKFIFKPNNQDQSLIKNDTSKSDILSKAGDTD